MTSLINFVHRIMRDWMTAGYSNLPKDKQNKKKRDTAGENGLFADPANPIGAGTFSNIPVMACWRPADCKVSEGR